MKVNRPINDCHCDNWRKFVECYDKGIFFDNPDIDFCINYEDETYPDDDDNENDLQIRNKTS